MVSFKIKCLSWIFEYVKTCRKIWNCLLELMICQITILDSKIHGANVGPTWGRQAPGGPHVGPNETCSLGILHVNILEGDLFDSVYFLEYGEHFAVYIPCQRTFSSKCRWIYYARHYNSTNSYVIIYRAAWKKEISEAAMLVRTISTDVFSFKWHIKKLYIKIFIS